MSQVSEPLSRADAAWLHAEAPTNHFVVTSLALLDSPLDVTRFKSMLSRRIAMHPRLSQVVADSPLPLVSPPRWVPARDFDLDAHIHRAALPGKAGDAELAAFIGDLVGQPLDAGRPLWQVHAVEGPGNTGALITRFHHSLGDGQAMVRMLLTLTDATSDGWRRRPARPKREAAGNDGRSDLARLLDSMPAPATIFRNVAGGAATLARLTLLDPDRQTPLRGELSLLKGVAWTKPMSLAQVKRIARASGCTINDVLVSVIAGGLGDYLRRSGSSTEGLRIRAMVPVNLRAAGDAGMTGNQFSLIYLELPLGVADPWERLMRVKLEMDRIKASQEPVVGWLLVQGLGLLPPRIEHMTSAFYAAKASLVLTNVIGPKDPVYIAGTRIRQMTFWEPESGGIGVGISIYSYAGDITVGVVADRHLVARPAEVTDSVTRALAELKEVAS